VTEPGKSGRGSDHGPDWLFAGVTFANRETADLVRYAAYSRVAGILRRRVPGLVAESVYAR